MSRASCRFYATDWGWGAHGPHACRELHLSRAGPTPRERHRTQVPVSALGNTGLAVTRHARWVAEELPDPWTTSKAAEQAAVLAAAAAARGGDAPPPGCGPGWE
jgi:hypothetical protein